MLEAILSVFNLQKNPEWAIHPLQNQHPQNQRFHYAASSHDCLAPRVQTRVPIPEFVLQHPLFGHCKTHQKFQHLAPRVSPNGPGPLPFRILLHISRTTADAPRANAESGRTRLFCNFAAPRHEDHGRCVCKPPMPPNSPKTEDPANVLVIHDDI